MGNWPSPHGAWFFPTIDFTDVKFSDFSTTTGLVRGCHAVYIGGSLKFKEVARACRHH
jgi:hypothetical protein